MTLLASLELSVLLVCLWGLVAILITGQFSAVVIIGCITALVIGYRVRRNGWSPSSLVANIMAALVLVISLVLFRNTQNLLITTVYLFLLLQVTKYVTRRTLPEIRWCYLISLFHVIGASVITTTITFGFMLVVYIFLLLISLRLYVMASGWEESRAINASAHKATRLNGTLQAPFQPLKFPRGLLKSALPLTIIILILTSGLFSAIPRLATQNLFQAYGPASQEPAVSAFSENVEFGAFTEIQQDDAVAMYVQPLDKTRPPNVRMRAVALDQFDGKAWKRTNFVSLHSGAYDFLPAFTTRLYPNTYTFRVLQPPGVTNFLFADSFATQIRLPSAFNYLVDSLAQSVYLADMIPKEFQYEIETMHEDLGARRDPAKSDLVHRPKSDLFSSRGGIFPDAVNRPGWADDIDEWTRRLANAVETTETWTIPAKDPATTSAEPARQSSEPDTPDDPMLRAWAERLQERRRPRAPRDRLHFYLQKCLQLPENLSSGRVADLAREWTSDQDTTFAKAMAVENHLQTEYGYSLTPRAKGNFIDDFLFEVREGHCEYFATSMAVLLRNIGIPARIVNGYYANEWNGISGNFTVRQRDAHSWVEAWMGNDYGWMTFDPTPPSGVARRSDSNQFFLQISSLMDAVRVRWYRYVVDYNISDQASAFHQIMRWRRKIMNSLDRINILKSETRLELGDFSAEIDWKPVSIAALIIASVLGWQGWRWIRQRQKSRMASIKFYDELLRLLARQGYRLQPGQTPREFAREVANAKSDLATFVEATEIFYQSRFSGMPPGQESLSIIHALKQTLRGKLEQQKMRYKEW